MKKILPYAAYFLLYFVLSILIHILRGTLSAGYMVLDIVFGAVIAYMAVRWDNRKTAKTKPLG